MGSGCVFHDMGLDPISAFSWAAHRNLEHSPILPPFCLSTPSVWPLGRTLISSCGPCLSVASWSALPVLRPSHLMKPDWMSMALVTFPERKVTRLPGRNPVASKFDCHYMEILLPNKLLPSPPPSPWKGEGVEFASVKKQDGFPIKNVGNDGGEKENLSPLPFKHLANITEIIPPKGLNLSSEGLTHDGIQKFWGHRMRVQKIGSHDEVITLFSEGNKI